MKKFTVLLLTLLLLVSSISIVSAQMYKVGIGEEPTTKNIWSAMGPGDATMFNFVVTNGYYSALYGLAYPTYSVVPGLAADDPSEFVEEDGLFVSTVPLRKGQKWTDGREFTADDVVFTYRTLQELDLQGNWATYHPKIEIEDSDETEELLARVEKVDDYTVKFYFKEKPGLAQWLYGVLNCTIMPVNEWGSVVREAKKQDDPAKYLYSWSVDDPTTIGGFDFAKWEKGSFWQNVSTGDDEILTTKIYENGRHEVTEGDWSWAGYGEEGSALKYEVPEGPFIDNTLFRLYSNQDSMIMALKKGDIDYMLSAQGLTKGFRQELEGNPDVEVVSNPSNGWRFMSFNFARYPFDIPEFSQAVATMIDRDFLLNSVLQGVAKPVATPVPPGNTYWYNDDIEPWGQGMTTSERVAEAVELLESAGFSWETKPEVDIENDSYTPGSGIIMPNGEKMNSFDMLTPPAGYDPLRATSGLWISMWMQDLGIPVRSKPTQFNVISEKVFSSKDFDAFILGWGVGGMLPDYLNAFFHTNGGFNVNGFSDPVFDLIAEKFMKASDLETARELAFEAQERLQKTLPYIILFSTPIYDAYNKDRVEFPTTEVLDGVQGFYGLPGSVKIIE